MSEAFARAVVSVAEVYLGCGALFALPFVLSGVHRIDPAARGATRGFRLLILPGVVLLWPFLAFRWVMGSAHPPSEVNAHRRRARARTTL